MPTPSASDFNTTRGLANAIGGLTNDFFSAAQAREAIENSRLRRRQEIAQMVEEYAQPATFTPMGNAAPPPIDEQTGAPQEDAQIPIRLAKESLRELRGYSADPFNMRVLKQEFMTKGFAPERLDRILNETATPEEQQAFIDLGPIEIVRGTKTRQALLDAQNAKMKIEQDKLAEKQRAREARAAERRAQGAKDDMFRAYDLASKNQLYKNALIQKKTLFGEAVDPANESAAFDAQVLLTAKDLAMRAQTNWQDPVSVSMLKDAVGDVLEDTADDLEAQGKYFDANDVWRKARNVGNVIDSMRPKKQAQPTAQKPKVTEQVKQQLRAAYKEDPEKATANAKKMGLTDAEIQSIVKGQ